MARFTLLRAASKNNMIDQYSKYKDSEKVKIVTCSFIGDNRGYSYLCDQEVQVSDIGVVETRDGPKCVTVSKVQDSSHIMPSLSFKKYGWLRGVVKADRHYHYQNIDNDIGVKPSAFEHVGVDIPKPEEPKDDLDDVLNNIFG